MVKLHDIPLGLQERAKWLMNVYGTCYITIDKEGKYKLYYWDGRDLKEDGLQQA